MIVNKCSLVGRWRKHKRKKERRKRRNRCHRVSGDVDGRKTRREMAMMLPSYEKEQIGT